MKRHAFILLTAISLPQMHAFAEPVFTQKCDVVTSESKKYIIFYIQTLGNSTWSSKIDAANIFNGVDRLCSNCCEQSGTIKRVIKFTGSSDVPGTILSGTWMRDNTDVFVDYSEKGYNRINQGSKFTCEKPKEGKNISDISLSFEIIHEDNDFCNLNAVLEVYSNDSKDNYPIKIINNNKLSVEFSDANIIFTRN